MYLFLILPSIALILFLHLITRHPKGYPPGSVTRALLLWRKKKVWSKTIAELTGRYGPVMGLKFWGRKKMVVVSGREMVMKVLVHNAFEARPTGHIAKFLYRSIRGGIIMSNGVPWQQQRKFTVHHMKDFGFGRNSMESFIVDEAIHFVQELRDKGREAGEAGVAMENVFELPVMNCLWVLIIGRRFKYDDPVLLKLWHLMNRAHRDTFSCAALLAIIPELRYFFPEISGYKQTMEFVECFWNFLQETIKNHRETRVEGQQRDFLDACIEEIEENNGKGLMTVEKIFPVCVDFFIAGADTNSSSLTFIILYLILYPDVQRKVQEEIDEVMGEEATPSMDHVKRMPYTTAVLLEVQRLSSVVSLSPRRTIEDVDLLGYRIPKNTTVYVNLHSVHMDEEYWKDPGNFRPERFLNEKGEVVHDEFLIPFGLGRRRCVGELFARNVLFLFTTVLLKNFNFSVPPNVAPPSTDVQDGIACHPKPYNAFLEERR